jgi:hypothetical protein
MRAESIRRYLKVHKAVGRWTTVNGALQAALAVPETYDAAKHADALRVLDQDADDDLRCVYCGELAATWDHLANNVQRGRYSGYGNRIYNLVPACRTCNERKGGKTWQAWLEKLGAGAVAGAAERIAAFAQRDEHERFGWAEIEAELPELAGRYVRLVADIRAKLIEADEVAKQIRAAVEGRLARP